jgi:hypothetical protein
MGLIYKIMQCGCIYSAGIQRNRACDPTISYCCVTCNEDLPVEGYIENLVALQMELDTFDAVELLQENWIPSSFIKEYLRSEIGKDQIEKMWENAQDLRIKYKNFIHEEEEPI